MVLFADLSSYLRFSSGTILGISCYLTVSRLWWCDFDMPTLLHSPLPWPSRKSTYTMWTSFHGVFANSALIHYHTPFHQPLPFSLSPPLSALGELLLPVCRVHHARHPPTRGVQVNILQLFTPPQSYYYIPHIAPPQSYYHVLTLPGKRSVRR